MAPPRKFTKKASVPAAAPVPAIAPAPTPAPAPAVTRSEIKGSGTTKAKATPIAVTHDLIAKRAYEIYASRGYAAGNPDDDWREAERQLRAGL